MSDQKKENVLRAIDIVGYDAIEPVIVAALATEAPLLLLGPHGTAKTQLLNWLAEALGLVHRHYNAALINFDDLVGFPVPNEKRTGVDYLRTPGNIWDAESVLIDEISRVRVDLQNRVFPIIHEKVVLGIPLPKLRFRWAAMNPPKTDADDEAVDGASVYEGSEPLDVALADRFPFVVQLPVFKDFAPADRLCVIRGLPDGNAVAARSLALRRIDATKVTLKAVRADIGENIAAYVDALWPLLRKIDRPASPRRCRFLHDAIASVIAAVVASGRKVDPKDATFLAVSNALPHPAHGQPIKAADLLAAHQQAWKLAEIPVNDPKKVVFAESDPVRRVALGLEVGLGDLDLSTLVQDAYASLGEVDRVCFAVSLFPAVSASRNLTAGAFETIGREWAAVENESGRRHQIASGSLRHAQWKRIADWVTDQRGSDRVTAATVNIALVLFEREINFKPEDVRKSFSKFLGIFPWKEV